MLQPRAWKIFAILAAFLAASSVVALQRVFPQRPTADGLTFAFNEGKPVVTPAVGRILSVGYPHALSSFLWLRFLLFIPPTKAPPGERSWVYYDLLTISQLDPDFLPVFDRGAVYLSIITEDQQGAEQLLKRGTELYPENAYLLGALGYHYQFEMNDRDRAGPYYVRAAKVVGAPPIFGLLASSYLTSKGSTEAAESLLELMARRNPNSAFRTRIDEKIKKLRESKKL